MKRHVETIGTIMEWHEQTFPDATLQGQCFKFEEEWGEALRAKTNEERLKELADMFIVACGVFRFDTRIGQDKFAETYGLAKEVPWHPRNEKLNLRSFTPEEVWEAVVEKMKVNRAREWKKNGDGQYRHKEEEKTVDEVFGEKLERAQPIFFSDAMMRTLNRELMEHAWRVPLSGPIQFESFPIYRSNNDE